ncbi:E3 ubiquitin ligase [Mycoblastus sanguinarius]|nr:E3 ubiquitin ligase [Mycoblastus sanguinarius]
MPMLEQLKQIVRHYVEDLEADEVDDDKVLTCLIVELDKNIEKDIRDGKLFGVPAPEGPPANVGEGALNSALRATVECLICKCLPVYSFLTACGHSSCYSCLYELLKSNVEQRRCPSCGHQIRTQPSPNYIVSTVFNSVFEDTNNKKVNSLADTIAECPGVMRNAQEAELRDKCREEERLLIDSHVNGKGLFESLYEYEIPQWENPEDFFNSDQDTELPDIDSIIGLNGQPDWARRISAYVDLTRESMNVPPSPFADPGSMDDRDARSDRNSPPPNVQEVTNRPLARVTGPRLARPRVGRVQTTGRPENNGRIAGQHGEGHSVGPTCPLCRRPMSGANSAQCICGFET